MSRSMQKFKSILPNAQNRQQTTGQKDKSNSNKNSAQTNILEPEIGFQISIEITEQTTAGDYDEIKRILVPELNVHLIAARHLPALFGFKIVQGYLIKVKLFPGSKRLDSSIQTNTWPKFNEHFRFPLTPDIKSSLKHSANRGRTSTFSEFTPEALFAGQFVVFTVYVLLELPPTTFNRFSRTYRSLKDKSSNLMQNIWEISSSVNGKLSADQANDDSIVDNDGGDGVKSAKGNDVAAKDQSDIKADQIGNKQNRRTFDGYQKDNMPALTISESRRNLGSVTCYLEPKIFQRNSRGIYTTEELWLPIKDITTTIHKGSHNNNRNLTNAPKGSVEIGLEVKELKELNELFDPTSNNTTIYFAAGDDGGGGGGGSDGGGGGGAGVADSVGNDTQTISKKLTNSSNSDHNNRKQSPQNWNRMTSQVKRKFGISHINAKMKHHHHQLALKVTTIRMRCNQKAKDELEHTAGLVYVKTTVYEHGNYIGSWKSHSFYPSLSTNWDIGNDSSTVIIPIDSLQSLEHIMIKTTLATKRKMGKKFVLGTVIIEAATAASASRDTSLSNGRNRITGGAEHMQLLLTSANNERITMWHCYQ